MDCGLQIAAWTRNLTLGCSSSPCGIVLLPHVESVFENVYHERPDAVASRFAFFVIRVPFYCLGQGG